MPRLLVPSLVVLLLAATSVGQAEIFQLATGGQVQGELLNKEQSPRTSYQILTPAGGKLTLGSAQVQQVLPQTDAEIQYDRLRVKAADTVDVQWELAQWCLENNLRDQRKTHLERIIALDGNHVKARHALGYSQVKGRWTKQNEGMAAKGYVRFQGAWRLPQEVKLMQEQKSSDQADLNWRRKLKMWSEWLYKNRETEARDNILAIRDPLATSALIAQLQRALERNAPLEIKLLWVEALVNVGTPAAWRAVAICSLEENEDEVRLSCLDKIVTENYRPAVNIYIQQLKSNSNVYVNRAAVGLAQMKDPAAIRPLIDALVTEHTVQVQSGPPGQMSSTFGTGPNSGGGAFSFGGGPKTYKQRLRNREVFDALVALTDKAEFGYEVSAWKNWYASRKRAAPAIDARRD